VIRLLGTTLALIAVLVVASHDPLAPARLTAAGPGFLSLLGGSGSGSGAAAGVLLGFAAASLGFGLGQPQLVSRYLAGASPHETQSAWWIYIGFVQFTWLAMTAFGAALRGVMPALADPEAGLPAFFEAKMDPVLTGLIIADVFATIAATSNALLVAIGQSITHDLGPRLTGAKVAWRLTPVCVAVGAATMGASLLTTASVQTLALGSVSLIGAGLAPAVMARVLDWPRTGASMIAAVLSGVGVAVAWRALGFTAVVNEAAPGIAAGVAANALIARLSARPT
jgi:sodium/proline symporter